MLAACGVTLLCLPTRRHLVALCGAHSEAVQALAAQVPSGEPRHLPAVVNDLLSTLAAGARLGPAESLGPPLFDLMRQAVQACVWVSSWLSG